MSRIAVDLDDTLLDFNSLARSRMAELARDRGDERLKAAAYSTWDEWRTPSDLAGPDAWAEIIEWCHAPEQILSRDPLPGSKDALLALEDAGHRLVYVSNRDPSTREATCEWLGLKGFPLEGTEVLCHTEDKLASVRGCQYIVDDRPKTLVGFVTQGYATSDHEGLELLDLNLPRKAFGLVMPYNRNLTDVGGIYLAPTWDLLSAYISAKVPSVA